MQHVTIETTDGIATITLARGKVNAMNGELLDDIRAAFERCDADDTVRGALLVGSGKCLSAGLDLKALTAMSPPEMHVFVEKMDRAFEAAFRFRKPLAAAVRGHAIAGGMVVAMCADFIALERGDYRVGLTELAVGVPFPRVAWEIVRSGVTPRTLRWLVNEADTHAPETAFERGFGDVLVDDAATAAGDWLATVTSRPQRVFSFVKGLQRGEAWARIDAATTRERSEMLEILVASIQPFDK